MAERSNIPIRPRTVAVLLMVIGAGCFVAARLFFGDQVLCLVASTMITFGGLGVLIATRRLNEQNQGSESEEIPAPARAEPYPAPRPQPPAPSAVQQSGPGDARVNGKSPFRVPVPENWTTVPRDPADAEPHPQPPVNPLQPVELVSPLASRVMQIFRQQGANVFLETQREDRCILRILHAGGDTFTALILERDIPVDLAELRALYALVMSSESSGGYLITGGTFTQRAVDWSQGKPLRLVEEDQLGDLSA